MNRIFALVALLFAFPAQAVVNIGSTIVEDPRRQGRRIRPIRVPWIIQDGDDKLVPSIMAALRETLEKLESGVDE